MRKIIARRLLIALISLWVAASLVFLIIAVAPGDFISQKLANLENQGAELRPTEIVGSVAAGRTTIRAPLDATLRSIAAEQDIPLDRLLEYNPDLSADEPLASGSHIVALPGRRLSEIAVAERLVLPEDAERGAELLQERNPDALLLDGDPWMPEGAEVALRESVSVAEFARAHRITAADLLEANPDGSPTNPDGQLSADTLLYPGDRIVLPLAAVTEAAIRHRLGLDRSLAAQYGDFLWGVLRFQYADSFQTQESALSLVAAALPRTVQLNLYAIILAAIIGLPLGLAAAHRLSGRAASALQAAAALPYALPSFWLVSFLVGIVVARGFFFDDALWSIPLTNRAAYSITQSPSGFFALYSLPALAAALPLAAAVFTAVMPDGGGGPERDRRALARRLLSALRVQLPLLISLNFTLEVAFGLPGLGLLLIQRLYQADPPVVAAVVCITALFLVFAYFALDIARAWLDRVPPDREAQA